VSKKRPSMARAKGTPRHVSACNQKAANVVKFGRMTAAAKKRPPGRRVSEVKQKEIRGPGTPEPSAVVERKRREQLLGIAGYTSYLRGARKKGARLAT